MINFNPSKRELVKILSIIHQITLSKNIQDIKSALSKAQELLGGDYIVCGIGEGTSCSVAGTPKIINISYPLEWLKIYNKKRLYLTDPIVLETFRSTDAQLWNETYRLYSKKNQRRFISKAQDFDLYNGVSAGLYHNNFITVFSFAGGSAFDFNLYEKHIASLIGPHFHEALVRQCRHEFSKIKLTRREREVLKWAKDGKTNWEISIILKISERTIKFHMKNVEKKLKAANKTHAIAIALFEKLIDF